MKIDQLIQTDKHIDVSLVASELNVDEIAFVFPFVVFHSEI